MPKGEPNSQTKATEKYRQKAGIITKSFKLKKELVDRYAAACEKAGVSQTGKIAELMEQFIREQGVE